VGAVDWFGSSGYLATSSQPHRFATVRAARRTLVLTSQRLIVLDEQTRTHIPILLNQIRNARIEHPKSADLLAELGLLPHGADKYQTWEMSTPLSLRGNEDLIRLEVMSDTPGTTDWIGCCWSTKRGIAQAFVAKLHELMAALPMSATTQDITEPDVPKAVGAFLGLMSSMGNWEGVIEARAEGPLITGDHTWSEWNDPDGPEAGFRELREDAFFQLTWDSITGAKRGSDATIHLDPHVGLGLLDVILKDFGSEGPEPWLAVLRDHGIAMTS